MMIETCPETAQETSQDEDPRVVAALEEYLDACERGRRPGRTRFLRQHPEIAVRLEECLDGLDMLRGASHHFEAPGPDATSPHLAPFDPAPDRRLGDYQLVGELGRGGMGVVYEAIQLSLGRRVAIKLLPFSATMDPRQVQRFQVEVQAAAQLHHPHIIPVHAVGYEAGTHYYSMQLIAGRPLATIIAERRETDARCDGTAEPPSRSDGSFFRDAARLGIQAAEALAHAHMQGIVHRDIKPANLLVDDGGHLWIADFGLARLQGDSGVTATGDLVGTLRYMSPEQARAQHGVVDHRTDQYSLGATLYELIAGAPAFEGADLQALVNQITTGEPVPPSRHEPSIPRDLETIVLKSMAREPSHRYPTMQEFADDLRRFLEDRPIRARRPSLLERAQRWMRRHRVLVASGAVGLMLAVVCLSISIVAIWIAMTRTAEIARARTVELHRAQTNLDLAGRALDMYLNTAEWSYPRDLAGAEQENQRLRTALVFYERLASQNLGDPAVKRRAFAAYNRVGDIQTTLGDIPGAEQAYRKALAIMEDLRAEDPGSERYLSSQAKVLEKFAGLFRRQRLYGPAEWSLEEAVKLLEMVARRSPESPLTRLALAHALNQQGGLKGETGRTTPALEDSRRALRLLQGLAGTNGSGAQVPAAILHKELASVYLNLGKWLQIEGQFAEAERSYTDGLHLLERLGAEVPDAPDTREGLASCRAMLGELLRLTHREDESEELLKQAIGGLEGLADDFPRIPRYREHVARVYGILSTLFLATDRPDDAAAARHRAMAHDPRLPRDHQVQVNNIAWYLLTAPVPTARNPVRGLELAKKAVFMAPLSWECWNTLGVAHYRNGEWDEAVRALQTATNRTGENAFDGFFLAMTHWRLGQTDEARRWLDVAETWRLQNRPDDVELLRFRSEAEQLIGTIGGRPFDMPALPTSIAEALRDPSFTLKQPCCTVDSRPANQEGLPADDALAVFEYAEQALLFMDLT